MVGSFLQRFVVTGHVVDQVAPRHGVAVTATAAAKVFDAAAARSETVAIAQSSLMWRAVLDDKTALAPSAAYYEAFQSWGPEGDPAGERRDFRSLSPTLEFRRVLSPRLDFGINAGYRWLLFKPDRDFDFNGPTAGFNLRWLTDTDGAADWEARAGAALEHRNFAGPVQVGDCATVCIPVPGTAMRVDDFVTAQAEVTRTGRVLVSLGPIRRQRNVDGSRARVHVGLFAVSKFGTAYHGRTNQTRSGAPCRASGAGRPCTPRTGRAAPGSGPGSARGPSFAASGTAASP